MKRQKNALVLFRGIGFWFGCFALVLKIEENKHNLEYGFEMKRQKNALVLFRGDRVLVCVCRALVFYLHSGAFCLRG